MVVTAGGRGGKTPDGGETNDGGETKGVPAPMLELRGGLPPNPKGGLPPNEGEGLPGMPKVLAGTTVPGGGAIPGGKGCPLAPRMMAPGGGVSTDPLGTPPGKEFAELLGVPGRAGSPRVPNSLCPNGFLVVGFVELLLFWQPSKRVPTNTNRHNCFQGRFIAFLRTLH